MVWYVMSYSTIHRVGGRERDLYVWYAMPCHAMPCHAMPCHAMPCHAMPCHAMPCHTIMVLSDVDIMVRTNYNVIILNDKIDKSINSYVTLV